MSSRVSQRRSRQPNNRRRVAHSLNPFYRSLNGRNAGRTSVITQNLSYSAIIASNGSGVINNLISLVPGTLYTRWTNLSAEYDECRVLGAKITVLCSVPNVTNTIAVTNTSVVVYDNDDATTMLSGLNNGLDYPLKRVFPAIWDNNRLVTLVAQAYPFGSTSSGVPWATCANPSQFRSSSFKIYGGGLTASTTYWSITVCLVTQFRGTI